MARVSLAAAAVLASLAVICPRVAQADGLVDPAGAPTTRAAVADHLRLTGFAVGELPIDLGVARAPRLYIWDPISWDRALPVTNMGLVSGLVVLQCDW